MHYRGNICISYEAGHDDLDSYPDQGPQPFEFALHHLMETLESFYNRRDIRVEKIEDSRLTLSFDEGSSRVKILYGGVPDTIRYINLMARWFVAETGAGSDEVKLLVWRKRRQSKHPSVA